MKDEDAYIVEVAYDGTRATADRLKALVRKPVVFDGGGNARFRASIGWQYASRRTARTALDRLRRVRGVHAYMINACLVGSK